MSRGNKSRRFDKDSSYESRNCPQLTDKGVNKKSNNFYFNVNYKWSSKGKFLHNCLKVILQTETEVRTAEVQKHMITQMDPH